MSWTRYLLHDFWTAREFERLDVERRHRRQASRRAARRRVEQARALEARVAELEENLAEATLLLRTLSDLCVQKGVVTAAEMAAHAEHLDALDGMIDGRLGPSAGPSDE